MLFDARAFLLKKMPVSKIKQFNIIILGVGGQGLITLLQIISRAAKNEGYDVKTSELHGLSQRGGSVEVHLRFGRKIYSPLVAQGEADLILSLEAQEALRGVYFSGRQTNFLLDKKITPVPLARSPKAEEIAAELKNKGKRIEMVPAAEICRDKFKKEVVAGVYLLGRAANLNLIPLKPASLLKAINEVIPEKYLDLNVEAFKLAA